MPPSLYSQSVTLRPARPEDASARFARGPEPDEHLRLYGIDPASARPFTMERAENWTKSLLDHPYAWVIERDGLLGSARLDHVDLIDRRACFAIGLLQSQNLGKGIGTEATRAVLTYAFSELKLHRVSLRVLAINDRAIRAYKKCGFQVEGRERETALVDGAWHDDLIMGVLEHEFA